MFYWVCILIGFVVGGLIGVTIAQFINFGRHTVGTLYLYDDNFTAIEFRSSEDMENLKSSDYAILNVVKTQK